MSNQRSSFPPAVILSILAIGVYGAPGVARAAEVERPNIVFILADDVGRDAIGCYGGQSYETPNIDRLANTGMKFHHVYSMPVCHPTRITFLTGRYPFRFKAGWGGFPKEEEGRTIAQVLRRAGYATAVAGKWQLALLKNDPQHPHRLGFDQYSLFGWHEGPRYYQPLIWQNGEIRGDVKHRYGPEVYCDFLIDFITKNRGRGEHRGRPFFAFYSMALCHDVTDDLKEPVPFAPGKDRYDSYAEMVAAMDVQVGRLIAALDRLKLREKTLVIFTTDNGTAARSIARVEDGKLVREPVTSLWNGQRVPGGKGKLTDAGTRVPTIASWPGRIEAGSTNDDLIDFADFLPTFAALAGAEAPEGVKLDGRSFAWRLTGGKGDPRAWVCATHQGKTWVRSKRYKLYDTGGFFDVETDAAERRPLSQAALPGHALKELIALQGAIQELGLE